MELYAELHSCEMKVSTLSLRKEVGVDGNLPNHGHDRSGVEIRLLFRKRERERERDFDCFPDRFAAINEERDRSAVKILRRLQIRDRGMDSLPPSLHTITASDHAIVIVDRTLQTFCLYDVLTPNRREGEKGFLKGSQRKGAL